MEYMELTIPSPLHLWVVYNFTSSKNTNKCLSWIIYKIARCCYNGVQYELLDITLQLIETEHHDDVIKWKHFPHCRPFVRGIHRSPVNSPHKGQWRGALMFFLICVWINGWVNNREAGDLRRYRAHYDVIVMRSKGKSQQSPHTSSLHPSNVVSIIRIWVQFDRVIRASRCTCLIHISHALGYIALINSIGRNFLVLFVKKNTLFKNND